MAKKKKTFSEKYLTTFTFAFVAGMLLSSCAAYFSVVGLMAVFPGATVPLLAMGASIEFGKVVAASWLFRNWDKAAMWMKSAMSIGVLVLMFLTSIGVFGFLSKAHLEAGTDNQGVILQIEELQAELLVSEQNTESLKRQLDTLDSSMQKLVDLGQVSKAITQIKRMKTDRDLLYSEYRKASEETNQLRRKVSQLKIQEKTQAVEYGPIVYIAELIYGKEEGAVDKATRILIVLIITVFDPMAILLLMASNRRKILKRKFAIDHPPNYDNTYVLKYGDKHEPNGQD